jgi:transglutaminase-like putative cysteine protease
MTSTLNRPRPVVQEQHDASGSGDGRAAGDDRGDPTLPATLALTLLTVVVAIGLGRLFADGSFLSAVLAAAIGAHAVMWAARRLARGTLVGLAGGVLVGILAVAWFVLPETTFAGIPTLETFSRAGHELSRSYEAFRHVVAPAPVSDGFVIAAVIGVVLSAMLADAAAFLVRATFEATIPSFTLFVFTATLGTARFRTLSVAGYLGALLLFLVLHEEALDSLTASWFASRARRGRTALLRTGALLGAIAVLAAVFAGPHMPGAGSKAVIRWRGGEGDQHTTRTTVSPLVNIRTRLVDRANVEVFTVRSSARAYWRLTSLDRFDGEIWSSEGSYKKLGTALGNDEPTPSGDPVLQAFAVSQLTSIWLPAAYEARRVEGLKALSYNPDSASVITDKPTTDGITYQVESLIPRYTADQLATAGPGGLKKKAAQAYGALPAVSPRVRDLALQVAGRGTPYQRAKALQDFFRSARFTYDLRVPAGHNEPALERFLFVTRRGYCEQFAGAYGVLARLVGLPTRVAVGFTTGELGRDGLYHVRDLNAHAWPEVFLDGFGWVAFEPTPGRGAPGAEDYTGQPESQASVTNPSTATTLGTTPTTEPQPQEDQGTTPTSAPATAPPPQQPQTNPAAHHSRKWLYLGGSAVLLIALVLAGIPTAKRMRRARRRRAATDPASRVLVAWEEAADALGAHRVARRPSETMAEYAGRASRQLPLRQGPSTALAGLADDAAAASYSSEAPDAESVTRAHAAVATIEASVKEDAGVRRRILVAIDPRPLFRSRRA